jgi:hypothetical protein
MRLKVMSSEAVRSDWRNVSDAVMGGTIVVMERYGKPLMAMIPYEDYIALQEQLEDLRDLRLAEAAHARYKADPSSARSWGEVKAEWDAQETNASDE